MTKFITQLFSMIFHPLWMPLIGFAIAVRLDKYLVYNQPTYQGIVSILILNIIIPGGMVLILYKRKIVSGIDLEKRKERVIPFFITLFFYLFSYVLFQYSNLLVSRIVYSYLLSIILIITLAFTINFWWKISVHLLAIGGILGTFLALNHLHGVPVLVILIVGVFIAGLVGFSRLYLNAHTPKQVYIGFLLGFVIQYFIISQQVFLKIF